MIGKQSFVSFILCLCLGLMVNVSYAQERTWRVAGDSEIPTIEAALLLANDGDSIEVNSGTYLAPITISKSIRLIGLNHPVIDGGGEGSLLLVQAPDVLVSGFTFRNSGISMNHEDAAVIVQAPRVIIENNTIEETLYGIYFAEADYGIARNNRISGYDLEEGRRGDAIRVYYSHFVLIENNYIRQSRDMLIWYADDITIRNNDSSDGRYGLHFMYSNRALVEGNKLTNNSIGAYLMQSDDLTMIHNDISNNRGPSGYGLALKDIGVLHVYENWLRSNRVGLYVDNSPYNPNQESILSHNLIAYNDIGLTMLPNVANNVFQENIFLDNTQQSSVNGRGNLQGNTWNGNYWSDYAGYDADSDGIGDMSYRSENLFDSLSDQYPNLRFFIYSPAVEAIDFAAGAFPSLRPDPRLIDDAPLMQYTLPDIQPLEPAEAEHSLIWVLALLIALGLLPFLSLRHRERGLL
jgi:nitrous oxidase accessory protein